MTSTVLVVEDDPSTRKLIEFVLSKEDFKIAAFGNGKEALSALATIRPDVVIADLMMPVMDGMEFTREVRAQAAFNKVPILIVTARDQTVNKYEAFAAGADDYIIKPFDPIELTFRVKALLRLTGAAGGQAGPEQLDVGRVRLEPAAYTAFVSGTEVQLTKLETAVLHYLMTHKDEVISAEQISTQVLGHLAGSGTRSVDAAQAHVRNLRQKIEADPGRPTIIVTVGRKGYRFSG